MFIESGIGSGFSSRRGEGDKLLDARGDSFQEEGGIADVVEPDRVTDVMLLALISGLCLVIFFFRHHVVVNSK